jgi:hypothetical protein
MALVINDRVKQSSTSIGTGAFALTGSVTGFELLQQELEIIIQLIIVSLIKAQMNLKLDLEH